MVKISGSLIYPPDPEYLDGIRYSVERLSGKCRLGIVVGGGPLARSLIAPLRSLGIPEALLDLAGIEASRLNALTVALALRGLAPPLVPRSIAEAVDLAWRYGVVVLGGLQPGQSTNAVAVSLAEALGADVVINLLKGVDGIYLPSPQAPGARRAERLTYDELEGIIAGMSQQAGGYTLFDHVALGIARRSSIKIVFMEGSRPRELAAILEEGALPGTIVGPGSDA